MYESLGLTRTALEGNSPPQVLGNTAWSPREAEPPSQDPSPTLHLRDPGYTSRRPWTPPPRDRAPVGKIPAFHFNQITVMAQNVVK